jgi:hypothetical protein
MDRRPEFIEALRAEGAVRGKRFLQLWHARDGKLRRWQHKGPDAHQDALPDADEAERSRRRAAGPA